MNIYARYMAGTDQIYFVADGSLGIKNSNFAEAYRSLWVLNLLNYPAHFYEKQKIELNTLDTLIY